METKKPTHTYTEIPPNAKICTQPCVDHMLQSSKIEIIESKLSLVEENTKTVDRLSTKVSLLLTIVSFIIVIVASGALYTFTGLANFKDTYSEHRLQLQNEIHKINNDDKEFIRKEIKELTNSLENKMSDMQKKIVTIEAAVNVNHQPKK
jgi:hypothetical protein